MRGLDEIAAAGLRTIGLEELVAVADLQERRDAKYLVPRATFVDLLDALAPTHRVLEIGGRRAFAYETTYFDSLALTSYRHHVQGRRRRFKCRVRHYLGSGERVLEVKLKDPRGRTVKHRTPAPPCLRTGTGATLEAAGRAFLRETLRGSYGVEHEEPLAPTLRTSYRRMTLAAPERGERLTCDLGLRFVAPDGRAGRVRDDLVLVESKSATGWAVADDALRDLGVRPQALLSKYCVGVGLTRDGVRTNHLRPTLRSFEPCTHAISPSS